jgi:hypothetical protein
MQCKKAIIYQNIWAKSHKADPDFSTIGCSVHKPDGTAIITYNICEAVLLMLAFCHLTMKTISHYFPDFPETVKSWVDENAE